MASLTWVVYEITGSGALLGAVLGMRAIPMLVFAPLSGVAADRYDRRRLLLWNQIFSAAVAAAFGATLALDLVSTWMLFAFVLLMGSADVFDRPARLTMLFELVPREIAIKAVALNIVGNSITRVLAPALAGYLIAWIGVSGNFFIQAGLLLVAAALLALLVIPRGMPSARKVSAFRDIAEGMRYAARDPAMRLLILLGAIEFFVLVPTMGTLFPIYAKEVFKAGPEAVGLMFTAVGIGGVPGGYFAGVLSRFRRTGLVQTAAILFCSVSIFGLALSPTFWIGFVAIMFYGAFEMLLFTANVAALQMLSPEAMRGRISSLFQIYPALISLGAIIIGPLADVAGAPGASAISAGVGAILIGALWIGSPRLRSLSIHARAAEQKP